MSTRFSASNSSRHCPLPTATQFNGSRATTIGIPVSCCSFNARLPDMVQIGGVFTPSQHRQRGYARAVVAGALLEARRQGVAAAILFTGSGNEAAQRAYLGIGFEAVGDYAITLFAR